MADRERWFMPDGQGPPIRRVIDEQKHTAAWLRWKEDRAKVATTDQPEEGEHEG